jgi:glycerol-3-phosphate dehydrogenase (NAD(P)+)
MIAVIGAGAMGTALAVHLGRAGRDVALLATAYDREAVEAYRNDAPHPALGVVIPRTVALAEHHEWGSILGSVGIIVLVVSTAGLVATVDEVAAHAPNDALWAIVTKGWDEETLRPAAGVVADRLGDPKRVVAVVGPSLAAEIATGLPAAVVVAGPDLDVARRIADVFASPLMRTYVGDDVAGVEVGAALKNVIAIAVGICDGLAEATGVPALMNMKAFLFSRGLVEMARLARAMGGRPETVLGLAGAGDLFVTCLGGRNARFGRLVGSGTPPKRALDEMRTTVEGYANARATLALASKHGLDMPIVRAVCDVIYEGRPPRAVIDDLVIGSVENEFGA